MSSPGYFVRPGPKPLRPPSCPNHPDRRMVEESDRVWRCPAFDCAVLFNAMPNQKPRARKS